MPSVRCEVRLMAPVIPVSGVCLVLMVLSLSLLPRTSARAGEQVTHWAVESDWSQQLLCSSTLNYYSIEANEDIRYYIAITTFLSHHSLAKDICPRQFSPMKTVAQLVVRQHSSNSSHCLVCPNLAPESPQLWRR